MSTRLAAIGETLARSTRYAEPYIATAALIVLVSNPVFYVIWHHLLPQPVESLALRVATSVLFLPLVFLPRWPAGWRRFLPALWHAAVFFAVPFMFTLMTLRNGYSTPWVLSMIAGAFLVTFFMHWAVAGAMFIVGAALAYAAFLLGSPTAAQGALPWDVVVVVIFTLVAGGAMNARLMQARIAQEALERRVRAMAGRHAALLRDRNRLLGHFLNNTVIDRLRRFEDRFGLDEALSRMTQLERKYCALMQADIRSFSKMFDRHNELQVAQLVAQCFSEITSIGQDLAVIKPVGDCIFLYSDVDREREDAVHNMLALACVFVQSVERVNDTLSGTGIPALNFGIALHAGDVAYGNLASDTMIDPTVIGSNVNQTARLEELNKSPAVHAHLGVNGIVMSEAFVWHLQKGGVQVPGLAPIALDELGTAVRDFEGVSKVWGLRREAALAYAPLARERIRQVRAARVSDLRHTERQSHRNVEYYHEMSGRGPNLIWSIFVNVSAWDPRRVEAVLKLHLPHLKHTISEGETRWAMLSTENEPGQYDENDVEEWVFRLIDLLVGPPTLRVLPVQPAAH